MIKQTTSTIATLLFIGAGILVAPTLRAGFEIANIGEAPQNHWQGYTKVYLDYGDNRMTAEEWESFVPPTGYLKNSPRHAEFNDQNTFTSPGMGSVQVETIGGYTWMFVAQTQSAMSPYNSTLFPDTTNAYQAAALTVTPPDGAIKFSSNEKNQEMIFWARENNSSTGDQILRYFITDEWGNKYIMGANNATTPEEVEQAFQDAVLPNESWVKSTGYLDETLSLMPAYSTNGQAHYNLFRDSADNTFFQFEWGTQGIGIATQIVDMPIWGGATDDNIQGRAGDDNLIHGAEGNDVIYALGNNDSLFGDAGEDTAVFTGNFSDYNLVSYSNFGAEIVLEGFGYQKSLYDFEWLQFDDRTLPVSAVPEPTATGLVAVGLLLVALMGFRRYTATREIH